MGIKLFQMNVKCAFLNGFLNEEMYVEQSLGFESSAFSNHVLKLQKPLYGLKQASRTCYEQLSKFLMEHGFTRRRIDKKSFRKTKGKTS